MRLAVGVQYDGSAFCGWQSQKSSIRTVQSCLEKAISTIANHQVSITCAGRTDAGVHGIGQVIHFDTKAIRSIRSWLLGINSVLPTDISLNWVQIVNDDFHARFSALSRCYQYLILDGSQKAALWQRRAACYYQQLETNKMHCAGQALVGQHDFSNFRAANCQAHTPVREIYSLRIQRIKKLVLLEIEANAYLYHMVRNITGVLIAIGSGSKPVEWAQEVLQCRSRKQLIVTAPAHGLYLKAVSYPNKFALPRDSLFTFSETINTIT